MDSVLVTKDPLSVDEITKNVTSPSSGAISLFIGTTRDNFEGKKVLRLEYEAYPEMAEKEMKKICVNLRQKWPELEHIAMWHRIGLVPITEASVILAVSSPHRKESLEAVPLVDQAPELKACVPAFISLK